ncbi:helix-turn-helix transcriptional regulator [Gemmiger formicilis]|uniref:helix-turn-helix domain-containing protein n=1 Tax=Gemmiger formicilis TaxID=745368 RepID=UPI00195B30B3|nr:helix-turn-helix transcriptional regulator [Gemmiger formicilis]MBM6914409.1 helix-turn-helix transcriptional regulator [Gemmiger formicilis]
MNDRIKELRSALGMNQTEFGKQIGIKQTTVAGYENGTRAPSDAVVLSICREFHVSEAWLRDGIEPMYVAMDDSDELNRIFEEIGASDDELIKAAIRVYWRLDEREKAAIGKLTSDLVAELDKKKNPGE